jgi:alpha-glucosidase
LSTPRQIFVLNTALSFHRSRQNQSADKNMKSRNPFSGVLSLAALCSIGLLQRGLVAESVANTDQSIVSPNGQIRFQLLDGVADGLRYELTFNDEPVIESSRLGITIDGVDLGHGTRAAKVEECEIDEQYACRGVHSTAVNHCRGAKFHLQHSGTKVNFVLEVRAFDDGVAFRHVVPGTGSRTPDAATAFTIPKGSTVWHHDLRGHYEGVHANEPIESIDTGKWIAPPMTFKLPREAGYAAITEAALVNYAGMALQADGNRVVGERLGHAQPVGRPFEIRFSKAEGERLSHAAAIDGIITTPWRVIVIGKDLNRLVNCDIIQSLSSPPDKELFPQHLSTSWVKPGRCVWKFLDGGDSDLQSMMDFSRCAAELGFEYNLIEGFWQRWSDDDLRSLVDYSRAHNVGIWLWKDSRALRTPEDREKFFSLCQNAGVVGVKIDFLDHEAKDVVDLYQVLLKEAALHQLMVNFHGSNKPSGESRTWPNEMTREGVRGMEARQIEFRSRHNTTLPFTRYLAGHGDYTPVVFGSRRGDTTAAHQIATAAVFTSPLLVYGGHPESLLKHPAVDIIKSIPSVWDETIVLPASEIGQTAALARRHGDQWFLAVLGGPVGKQLEISLSFLNSGAYGAMLVRDVADDPTKVTIENAELSSADSLHIELADGGGFIARFSQREYVATPGPNID